jgi:hypothetical protein
MPDELYSIVVDYLTKGGKLPTITMPPQVVVVGSGAGAGAGASSAVSTIASAVIASLIGGLFGAFAKTKAIAKIPVKKKLGVQTAKVFRNKEQIMVDRRAMAESKAMRNDLKATAIKLDVTQKKLAEVTKVRDIERSENIANQELVYKLQKPNDFSAAMRDIKGTKKVNLNDIIKETEKSQNTLNISEMSIGPMPMSMSAQQVKIPKVNFAPIVAPVSPAQQKVIAEATKQKGFDNSAANTIINKQNSLGEVTQ